MTLNLNISLDVSQLIDWDLVPAKDVKKALRAATASYMLDQRKNIKAGRTVGGVPFVKYSHQYLDKKTRAGRMSGPSGSVDNIKGASSYWLRLTGQMMRSQKARFKKFGKGYQATVAFEGMQAPAAFSDPYKKSAYKRATRSQRGGFESTWRAKEQARKARIRTKYDTAARSQRGGLSRETERRLTVNFVPGDMQSSAFIAWQNDKYRPFIGMNGKMMNNAYRAFKAIINRHPDSVKLRNA